MMFENDANGQQKLENNGLSRVQAILKTDEKNRRAEKNEQCGGCFWSLEA